MKFTSILFVAAFVLAVSAAPCKDKSHKHPKNKPHKSVSYKKEYEINNNYHNVDNSSNDRKEITQINGDTGSSSDKGLGVNVGIGTKTENISNNNQKASISK